MRDAILTRLLQSTSSLTAHLEYQVKAPMGRGKASHTDLMLLNDSQAIAMEAKWTEPRYPEVCAWDDKSTNRQQVLEGWLSLIRPFALPPLARDNVHHTVYQMLHRTASACSFHRSPTLAYLQFKLLPDGQLPETSLVRDLEELFRTLGSPAELRFCLVTVFMSQTEGFGAIRNLPKGVPETAHAVKAALLNGPIFYFVDFDIQEFARA